MEQITILISDQEKGRSLLDLLRSLDFVSVVDVEDIEPPTQEAINATTAAEEFLAAAGIWRDRDITVESLRAAAWPGRDL